MIEKGKMKSSSVALLLLLLTVSCKIDCGKSQDFNQSEYRVTLTEEQVSSPGQYVLTLGFTQTPNSNFTISIIGSDRDKFDFNSTTYIFTTAVALPADNYVIVIASQSSVAVAYISVVAGETACESQAFGKCSHVCTVSNSSQRGYICSCLEHYTLQSDGLSCRANAPYPLLLYAEGDSIVSYDPLTHQSRSIYSLPVESGNSIDLFVYGYSSQIIYYVNETRSLISSLSFETGETLAIASNIGKVEGLTFDWVSGNLYFTDSIMGWIGLYHVISGHVTPVLQYLPHPRAAVVFPEEPYRFIFWAEGNSVSNSTIKRANLNGSNVVTIATEVVNPVAMAIDVVDLKLYWVSDNGRVCCSSFDGSNQAVVYVSDQGAVFGGIAVFEDFIYLTNSANSSIIRINKLTTNERPIVLMYTDSPPIGPIHVNHSLLQTTSSSDFDECLINNGGCGQGCVNTIGSYYCTCIHGYSLDEDERTCHNADVCDVDLLHCTQSCSNATGSDPHCTCNPGYALNNDGVSCQDINECAVSSLCSHGCHNTDGSFHCSCPNGFFLASDRRNCIGCSNGTCSQLCVTGTDSFHCACRPGFTLGTDGRSCFPSLDTSLIFSITQSSSGSSVGSIYDTSLTGVPSSVLVPIFYSFQNTDYHTGIVYALDVDVEASMLYFCDRNSSELWSTQLNGNEQTQSRERILTDVLAWGMTYDWINGYLYWSEDQSGKIRRVSTNGSSFVPETVYTGLDTPRGVVVNPFSNHLYWTEGGSTPAIKRGSLINSTQEDFSIPLSLSSQPTGITIDYINSRLIWGDQASSSLVMSDLNGNDITVLLNASMETAPFQLVLNGDRLYWTTEGSSLFSSVSLFRREQVNSLDLDGITPQPVVYGITTIDQNKRPNSGYHICLLNSLDCSHYCVVNSVGIAQCSCPTGYVLLTDQKTCARTQSCIGQARTCTGDFANITASIPFFLRPDRAGLSLNSLENPLQYLSRVVSDCSVLSVEYLDTSCQYSNVSSSILSVAGSQLVGIDVDDVAWALFNGRTVTVQLQCSAPSITPAFCVNFEVSSANRAVSCGHSNGGCSHFCTVSLSSIPVCSCPHGLVLGQDGYTCFNPCDPNPCQNGGVCQLTSSGHSVCQCQDSSYTGRFCSIPSQPDCGIGGICTATPIPTIQRLPIGDRLVGPGLFEGVCSAVGGYCVGEEECSSCACPLNRVYQAETESCVNLNQACPYIFNDSSVTVPTLYISDSSYLITSMEHSLTIIQSTNRTALSQCSISNAQINTFNGWTDINASTFELTSDAKLKIGSGIPTAGLTGQLVRVTFSCSVSEGGCLLFRIFGHNTKSPYSEICNDCEGNFEGYYNLGIPTFARPNINDTPLTNRTLQFNRQDVLGCNTNDFSVTYSRCNGVQSAGNIIYATQNRLQGRNINNVTGWNAVTNSLINATVSCQSGISFCVLFTIENSDNNDPCSPSPCSNNGSCTTVGSSGYRCSCPEGFTGPTCSEVDYCLSHTCLNSGVCINGPGYASCLCPADTVPPYCIGPDDRDTGPCLLSPCDNGGICIPKGAHSYICQCPGGFTGLHCNTIDACFSSPCPVNATCVPKGSSHLCLCQNSSQSGCDDICDPDPCLNGGTCLESDFSYTCSCADGFFGDHCQIELIEVPENASCLPNPCQNGGTCDHISFDTFTCTCPPDFTGDTCDTSVNDVCDPNPCFNSGTCNPDSPDTFTCTCPPDFTGDTCNTSVNDVCDPNPCLNNGTCNPDSPDTFTCACPPDFTGNTCKTSVNDVCDPNPCFNSGTCNPDSPDTFTCTCPPGYRGDTCQIPTCDPNPCNNGTCELSNTFTCDCFYGYAGPLCDDVVDICQSDPCNNGTCTLVSPGNINCDCFPGFTGTTCNEVINLCDPNPCNSGSCTQVSFDNFTCDCPPGFTGDQCQTDIDECDLYKPCNNGGTCTNTAPGFNCQCAPGYNGSTCSDECPEGRFGQNCESRCQCVNHVSCNHVDGSCTCQPGYTGLICDSFFCESPCLNGGTCSGPLTCSCVFTYTENDCSRRFCPADYCRGRGTCFLDEFEEPPAPVCNCNRGYFGTRCDFQRNVLSSNEAGGLSAGVIIGVIIIIVIVVAVVIFFKRSVYPNLQRRKAQRTLWHLDSTLVHENPAVAQSLLENGRTPPKNTNCTNALDNPIYGTIPAIASESDSEEFSASFGEFTEPEEPKYENPINTRNGSAPFHMDKIPNAVVINRYVDTASPERGLSPVSQDRQPFEKFVKISMPSEQVDSDDTSDV